MRDLANLMKQAQQLQTRMAELQQELETTEVEGSSGGGLVTVRLSAKGEMRGVKIDPSLIKPDEAEILEDLILAAHSEARRRAEQLMQDKMKELTGGLPIPPGMIPGM
jgi:nucleoid-associated protein EbfC